MNAKRVLVTGARGYFGPWVVRELHQHGYHVVAADARAIGDDAPAGVEPLRFGLYDHMQLAAALDGCSGVVHLAAYPSPGGRRPELVFRNNTGATASVLEAAARAGVTTAVVASSTSIFGLTYAPHALSPRYVPIDEDHPLELLDPYALTPSTVRESSGANRRAPWRSCGAMSMRATLLERLALLSSDPMSVLRSSTSPPATRSRRNRPRSSYAVITPRPRSVAARADSEAPGRPAAPVA
jgi:hypothetical protein